LKVLSVLHWGEQMTQPKLAPLFQNGDANKLIVEDQPVHGWYRFVLSFPAHLVRHYLERFRVSPTDWVLDPFCGTGTTLVECKKQDIPSVGMEPHPVAHLASVVKTDWSIGGFGLITHARHVAEKAAARLAQQGICDTRVYAPTEVEQSGLRRLPAEAMKLLLKGSISPVPLHKTLVLLDALRAEEHSEYHRHEMLALARALNTRIGNLHFGPEVGVTQPKVDMPVVGAWLECIHAMGSDLAMLEGMQDGSSVAHCADARDVSRYLEPESVSAVITSPPYPNEKDYTRITRLESVVLGFVRTKAELRALKQRLVRSNTRGVYSGDDDDTWVADHPSVQRIASAIEARRIELGKTSGFERQYASVTKLYFGGMKRHLSELRQCLRKCANLAYVVGDQASYLRVMIRTGTVLAEIAESLGYEVVGIDLFRTRLATATREQLREEVVVLRWPGTG
jgi:hypothetical protein